MDLSREIRSLSLVMLIGFGMIVLSAMYWAVRGPETILLREDNPRLVEREAAIRRGSILDRQGVMLAETVETETGLQRRYPVPAMYSAVGYFSLRYGVGGAESTFDALLAGDERYEEVSARFVRDVFHRPQRGSDIRLTLDAGVQESLIQAMQDRVGAGVVMSIPEGDVLALVSQPTFDPNTLNATWDDLIDAPDNPFFNRALQGQYQPGSAFQTPLVAASILAGQSFDLVTAGATAPVRLEDVSLGCAARPPQNDITLRTAYAYACPRPFALLIARMPTQAMMDMLAPFRFDSPVTLANAGSVNPPLTATPNLSATSATLQADLLGQGNITVNPLHMTTIAAAVINGGSVPQPHLLAATRAPDDTGWVETTIRSTPYAYMTEETATRLRDLMIANVVEGAAASASREGLTIGGHIGVGFSGDDRTTWFIGFVRMGTQHGAAIALALENTEAVDEAAVIGGTVLERAAQLLAQEAGIP